MNEILASLIGFVVSVVITSVNLPKNENGVTFNEESEEEIAVMGVTGVSVSENKVKIKIENNGEDVMGKESNLNEYLYPKSTLINESDTSLKLKINDEIENINNWYESLLKSKSKSMSFVKTKTNGTIENVLAIEGIKVTIKGSNNNFEAEITVDKSL